MGQRLFDHVNVNRLWYSHEVAIEQAALIAAETGVRQRVKRIDADSNTYRCAWLIEEI